MKNKSIGHVMVLAAAGLLTGLCLPAPSRADNPTINPGFDFFTTDPNGTVINGVKYKGVPLGSYGQTDTIVQRLSPAVKAVPGTFNFQINALQLMSVVPMLGPAYFYITLDPSIPSGGTLTIDSVPSGGSPGTFSSFFDVFIDVRLDSLSGPIEETEGVALTGAGFWSNDAPPGALTIPGVNYDLNGVDTSADFWPVGEVLQEDSVGDQIEWESTVPDATCTLALLLIPLGLFAPAAARGRVACRA